MAYKYFNRNPNGYKIPDCVIRAISTALNINYYDVVKLLHQNAIQYRCDDLCVCCYEKLLDIDLELPHYYGNNRTVKEIADKFCNEILLLRIEGHLTTSVKGTIYDIWDCSNEIVTDFWVIKY
jgi:hypothetical protein